MSDNSQSYSAKGEVSNITKRRTRFERIKIAFSKAPLSAWFGMIVISIYLIAYRLKMFYCVSMEIKLQHIDGSIFLTAYRWKKVLPQKDVKNVELVHF